MGCAEVILNRIESSAIAVTNSFNPGKGAFYTGSASVSAFADVIEKIRRSSVEAAPFPALYLRDLFPNKYYEEMQRFFPRLDQMQSLGKTGRVSSGAYRDRLVTLFTEEHFQKLDQTQQDFWRNIAQALTSEEFIHACINKFAQGAAIA